VTSYYYRIHRENIGFYYVRRDIMKKRQIWNVLAISAILIFSALFLFSGCGAPGKTLDKSIKGPQLIVNPDSVTLGVVGLLKSKVIFSGSGFQPKDSVFIKLLDVPLQGKKVDVPIASGNVGDDGTFHAPVGTFVKVTDILRAKTKLDDELQNVIVITGPPMAEGTYTALAESMLSEKKAECTFKVEGPSVMDGIKDWLGGLLGKIEKK
jgi:hypothetical protein